VRLRKCRTQGLGDPNGAMCRIRLTIDHHRRTRGRRDHHAGIAALAEDTIAYDSIPTVREWLNEFKQYETSESSFSDSRETRNSQSTGCQITGALAALNDSIVEVQEQAFIKLGELNALDDIPQDNAPRIQNFLKKHDWSIKWSDYTELKGVLNDMGKKNVDGMHSFAILIRF